MKQRTSFYTLIIIGCCLFMTGCGIHLRQLSAWPPEMDIVHFDSANPNSPLSTQLRQTMQSFNVTLVPLPEPEAITFRLENFLLKQSYPSISTASLATTYTLTLSVTAVLLTSEGHPILPPKVFVVTHSIILSADQVLIPNIDIASSRELQRQAATLIYYWLTSSNVKLALSHLHTTTIIYKK